MNLAQYLSTGPRIIKRPSNKPKTVAERRQPILDAMNTGECLLYRQIGERIGLDMADAEVCKTLRASLLSMKRAGLIESLGQVYGPIRKETIWRKL